MKLRAAFLMLLLVVAYASGAQAASFDCAKARSFSEKAICGNEELSTLEEEYAAAYKKALAASPEPTTLRKMARENLKLRELCQNTNCVRDWLNNSKALFEGLAQGEDSYERITQAQDTLPGDYITNPGEEFGSALSIKKGTSPEEYDIEVTTITEIHHTCDFEGSCTRYGKDVLICSNGDFETDSFEKKYDLVLKIINKDTVEVVEHSQFWCGMGATMEGTYVRH